MIIGLIGAGNMGSAIISGAIKRGQDASRFRVFDIDKYRAGELGALVMGSVEELAAACDMLLIAVKPNQAASVFNDVGAVCANKAIVSIMAGIKTDILRQNLPNTRVLRAMPNTPFLVGEGATVLSTSNDLLPDEYAQVRSLFETGGLVFDAPEALLDSITGLSGSGPAFVFTFIEAMADAAVREGIPRTMAYALSAQTVKGAAQMVINSGKTPAQLKDMVASPAGTTIEGLAALEKGGLRAAVMDAVKAAAARSRELGG